MPRAPRALARNHLMRQLEVLRALALAETAGASDPSGPIVMEEPAHVLARNHLMRQLEVLRALALAETAGASDPSGPIVMEEPAHVRTRPLARRAHA